MYLPHLTTLFSVIPKVSCASTTLSQVPKHYLQAANQESFFTEPGALVKPRWPQCYLTQLRKAEPKKS